MISRRFFLLGLSFTLIAQIFNVSCSGIGPMVLPKYRESFNAALLQSDEEQLLLNIVRLRFADRPYFLGVNSITTSNSLALSAAPNFSITPFDPITGSVGISPSVSYSDSPTLSYVPLQGEVFTKQMLRPIKLETIALMLRSGWSVARLLRITANSLGSFLNAPNASRASSSRAPVFTEFKDWSHRLRALDAVNLVDYQLVHDKNFLSLEVRPSKRGLGNGKLMALFREVGAAKKFNFIRITESKTEAQRPKLNTNLITLEARSFIGILYYLSKSVEILPSDIENGIIEQTSNEDGSAFDWSQLTDGIMRIQSSKSRPSNPSIAVYYRDRWFYIADNDSNSKETFALLQQLFSVQAGELPASNTVYTISANK